MFINKTSIDGIEVQCYQSMHCAVSDIIDNYVGNGSASIAVAINPEKILSAYESEDVRKSLMLADIRYLDGIGAVKVAEKKTGLRLARIPGCDLWLELMKLAGKKQIPVYLLGSEESVIKETVSKLENEFDVRVVGCRNGYFRCESDVISEIKKSGAEIVTVALGSPKQEIFMKNCANHGVNAFMMGVGGTYNVYTNKVNRAPEVWRKMNLEWLYRLIKEPTRIKRQIKLLRFIFLYLQNKI